MTKSTFIHLSDIHIIYNSDPKAPETNKDVRVQLGRDLEYVISNGLGEKKQGESTRAIDAIFLTGDVAYSGKESEYQKAREWLKQICDLTKCNEEDVFVVPGNHDVDLLVAKDFVCDAVRKKLRDAKSLRESDEILKEMHSNDREAANILFKPLGEYVKFASPYKCEVSPDRYSFGQVKITKSGHKVFVWGINSCLVADLSNSEKEGEEKKLVVTEWQAMVSTDHKCDYVISLCHHPLNWIRHGESLAPYFNTRTNLQLFGHIHSSDASMIGKSSLKISAGAVHPSHEEDPWIPAYNIIEVTTPGSKGVDSVDVSVFERHWDNSTKQFSPTELTPNKFCLLLKDTVEDMASKKQKVSIVPGGEGDKRAEPAQVVEQEIKRVSREAYYQFMLLPYTKKMKIIVDLKLNDDIDEGKEDLEKIKSAILRAEMHRKVDQFETEVKSNFEKRV